MRRVVSVWFPHWPTDRRRRSGAAPQPEPGGPVVTALHDGRRRVIAAVDQAAAAQGLRPGMAVAQALAVLPGLLVTEAEPDADADALRRLARWCDRFTPLASVCPPDGLWLDMTGGTALFGGETAMLQTLLVRLARDGLQARAAMADTPGAAHALARHGDAPLRVVPPAAQAAAIGALPLTALRLPPELLVTLRRLGFDQVSHLSRIPRALLARRFGPLPGLRLDQAYGHVEEPLTPLAPEHTLQCRTAFMEPLLTAEALATGIAHLLGPLCETMERHGVGARQIDLVFERVDGQTALIRIGTAQPSRDAPHLIRMLQERLNTVDPGLGVEAMQASVPLADPLEWQQQADDAPAQDVSRLVDRLTNRLGAERVYRAAPVHSALPERSVRKNAPVMTAAEGKGRRLMDEPVRPHATGPHTTEPSPLPWKGPWRTHNDADRQRMMQPAASVTLWPRRLEAPTRLLNPPRPIDALAALPDQPPVAFTWRRHRHRISHADGPERIHGEWWLHNAERQSVRDYFQVEDESGRRFWLFRHGDGLDLETGDLSWFLHGLF